MITRRTTILGAAAAVAVPATAFVRPSWAQAQELHLGYLTATSGPFATLAKRNIVAVELAVADINRAGGVNGRQLKLTSFDTGGRPDQAVIGVRRFAQDSPALAVVGPFSTGECRVSFPAGERAGISQMSMASSAPGVAKPFTFAFRNTTDEGIVLNRVVATLKSRNIPHATGAVAFATDDAVSQALGQTIIPAVFQNNAIALRTSVSFRFAAFDLAPQVSQLVQSPTDIIGVGSPPEAMQKLAIELRRQGHKGRMIAGTTVADFELAGRMGEAGAGTIVGTSFFAGRDDAATRTFAQRFKEGLRAAGEPVVEPNQFDANSYDIVGMYAEAMRRANVTGAAASIQQERAAVRDQLRRLRGYAALAGSLSIGEDGDALKPVYTIESTGSAWRLLDSHAA